MKFKLMSLLLFYNIPLYAGYWKDELDNLIGLAKIGIPLGIIFGLPIIIVGGFWIVLLIIKYTIKFFTDLFK